MGKMMLSPLHQELKRKLFEETNNMAWRMPEKEIAQWCKRNKVYDEITEKEFEEIWQREDQDENESIRLNGKYV